MKLFLLLFPALLVAQAATLTPSFAGPVRAGGTATLILTLGGTGAATGLQWTLAPPAGFTVSSPAAGAAAANKTLACFTGNLLCLVYGLSSGTLNAAVMPAGVAATLQVTIPRTATGSATFNFSGLFAVGATGVPIPLTATPLTIAILPMLTDLNGDGQTNVSDVQAMVSQVAGGTCSNDQNGDGVCNLIDVMLVILGALAP